MSNHHIFTTNKSNNESFYCLIGKEDFLDDSGYPRVSDGNSADIAAKIIQNKKSKHFNDNSSYNSYYIKCSPNNSLYNPIELYAMKDTKTQYGFIDKTCKNKWSFKEVDHHIFYKYLTFLRTKNISWLKDAERELK
jgi:hypothetical protein